VRNKAIRQSILLIKIILH